MQSLPLPAALALLWLIGIALRLAILAVPPVIPAIRDEFNLTGTEVGILTGLPVILFAAAALVGSRLVSRLGAVTAAVSGLLLTALGSALRGVSSEALTLFAATTVTGFGVAVTQPAMPALVGRWLPNRIGLGTGIYTNGLLIGEVLPVALYPLLFSAVGASWRATFVFWAVPIAAIAFVLLAVAPRERQTTTAASARWWPDWPARDIVRLGSVFAGASALYFASNAFLPPFLTEAGRADLISPALTALNLGQVPASLLLIFFPKHFERRAWPFVLAALIALLSIAGILWTGGMAIIASAAVLGFTAGGAFALGLTMPPLLSPPQEVARLSAAMFTISYTSAVAFSVLSGLAWDMTGTARFAFLPIALSALPMIVLAPTIGFVRKQDAVAAEE